MLSCGPDAVNRPVLVRQEIGGVPDWHSRARHLPRRATGSSPLRNQDPQIPERFLGFDRVCLGCLLQCLTQPCYEGTCLK